METTVNELTTVTYVTAFFNIYKSFYDEFLLNSQKQAFYFSVFQKKGSILSPILFHIFFSRCKYDNVNT